MTLDDLFAFKRVGDPQISPDGKQVVYQVTTVDLDANKTSTNLWVAATDGKTPPRQLTTSSKRDRHPRWSPDGKQHPLRVEPLGRDAALGHRPDGRRGPAAHHHRTGAVQRHLVAGRQARRVRLGGLPGVQREAVRRERQAEQGEGGGGREEPGQGEGVHQALLPPLGRLRRATSGSTCSSCRRDGGEPRRRDPGDRDAYPTSTTFSVGDDFTFTPGRQAPRLHRRAGEGRGVEHQLRPLPRVDDNTSPQVGDADEGQHGRRQLAAVLPGRQEAGLPRPEEGRATRRTSGTFMVADVNPDGIVGREAANRHGARWTGSVERVRLGRPDDELAVRPPTSERTRLSSR